MSSSKQVGPARSLDYRLPVDRVPEEGVSIQIEPGAFERAALAGSLDLVALDQLEAHLEVYPAGHGVIRGRGELSATVTQLCVVSLEPVTSTITETIDVEFRPKTLKLSDNSKADSRSRDDVDPLGETDFEDYDGVELALGALVSEILAAGINPYPRIPGLEFAWTEGDRDDPTEETYSPESPFAKLASIDIQRGRSEAEGD